MKSSYYHEPHVQIVAAAGSFFLSSRVTIAGNRQIAL